MADGKAIPRKLVVIGDGACGKTCLLIVFANDEFPEQYVPTVFENYVANHEVDGQMVELALWDTAGQEDYAHIRPLSYSEAHVFLVCFSIDNRDSFDNIEAKWVPEMRNYEPKVPYVLVGCKTDLRGDDAVVEKLQTKGQTLITTTEGTELAQRISAYKYVECSAKTKQNVTSVFDAAAQVALTTKTGGGGCCVVM
eukprot:m.19146 g.19146  ORF g.19146 m.19146 type:complete len:196 (+) comp5882_c0_seq1:58-645(+)